MLYNCMENVIKSRNYNQATMQADMDLFKEHELLTDQEYINLTKLMIQYPGNQE